MDDDENKLSKARRYSVVKRNDIIQKSRSKFSLREQKIIMYLVSKLKMEDSEFEEYTFDIRDYCRLCGEGVDSGGNYEDIKEALKKLRDNSVWIKQEDGSETTLAWLEKVTVYPNSGKVKVKFDDMLKPYLLKLNENFTEYQLLYTLGMKSK